MDTIIVCERMGKARSAFRLGRDTGKGSLPGARVGGNTIRRTAGPLCDQTEPNGEGIGPARVLCTGKR
jgi:hypothetical protein